MEGATEAARFRKAEKTVAALLRENEALRTVLARLYHENVRLAESAAKAKRRDRRQRPECGTAWQTDVPEES